MNYRHHELIFARGLIRTLLLTMVIATAGCETPNQNGRLYRDLGGREGITEIADGFLYYMGQDDRVVDFFAHSDIDRFHSKVIEHICDLSGGPCEYTGDDMLTTHIGMGINETQFNATVENLIAAMDDAAVPVPAQNRLLRILARFHGDIVGQ